MSRAKKLAVDFDVVFAKSINDDSRIKEMQLEDETCTFMYDNGKPHQKVSFSLNISDYPDGYSMLFASDLKDPRMITGNLQTIIDGVLKEYDAKSGISGLRSSRGSSKYHSDEEDGSEQSADSDGEDWREEAYQTEVSYQENKELTLEAQNYAKIYGEKTVVTRPMPLLETVEVELSIVYEDILNQSVCSAWGVDHKLPIVVKLSFSALYFLEAAEEPKVELYQGSAKKSFGLKFQLEAIAQKFLRDVWPKHSGKKIKAAEYKAGETVKQIASKDSKSEKKSFLSGIMGKKEKEKKTDKDGDISKLVDMGFSLEMAKNALQISSNFDEAVNLLLNDPESFIMSDSQHDEEVDFVEKPFSSEPKASSPSKINDLFTSPNKALSSHKTHNIPSTYGLLVMIATYLRQRLPHLNDYCVICDQPHVFANGNMLKPAVCARDLCVFSFQTLGVAGEFVDSIATGAEVVDLLISFATIAAKSARKELIFEPYPNIFDPNDPKRPILSPTNKDFGLLNTILSKFPSVEQMSKSKDFTDMRTKMDRANPHAFNLMQWIITSNRSHIVKINTDKQIKSMATPHQYLLLSAPPEKEALFKSLKAKHGSVYAFHGSSSENWHCILRVGLKNASGTKLQVNGAAHGAGIYLSPHAATSFAYCRMNVQPQSNKHSQNVGNQFLNSENINCIAICEVINHEIRKSGSIWVQPNPDYVVTRFFFVYTSINPGGAVNVNTESAPFVNEIRKVAEQYY
eukprot:TRINITY_DN5911_c0_g1_i1.p1 TRINITY_DN5911_c0_g1~~TRINITY_DN5911_c0_g1_i1.p1  ORF type:complete len:741 (-),score=192.10 TRINITY_DN5911_c0_g1_i1:3-2225(-)